MGPMEIAQLQFHGNGNGNNLMGMGGNKNLVFSHFTPARIADCQALLMESCFCIVICRRLFG